MKKQKHYNKIEKIFKKNKGYARTKDIGNDVVKEAINEYLRKKEKYIDKLLDYASQDYRGLQNCKEISGGTNMTGDIKNMAASARQRLYNIAKKEKINHIY